MNLLVHEFEDENSEKCKEYDQLSPWTTLDLLIGLTVCLITEYISYQVLAGFLGPVRQYEVMYTSIMRPCEDISRQVLIQ